MLYIPEPLLPQLHPGLGGRGEGGAFSAPESDTTNVIKSPSLPTRRMAGPCTAATVQSWAPSSTAAPRTVHPLTAASDSSRSCGFREREEGGWAGWAGKLNQNSCMAAAASGTRDYWGLLVGFGARVGRKRRGREGGGGGAFPVQESDTTSVIDSPSLPTISGALHSHCCAFQSPFFPSPQDTPPTCFGSDSSHSYSVEAKC